MATFQLPGRGLSCPASPRSGPTKSPECQWVFSRSDVDLFLEIGFSPVCAFQTLPDCRFVCHCVWLQAQWLQLYHRSRERHAHRACPVVIEPYQVRFSCKNTVGLLQAGFAMHLVSMHECACVLFWQGWLRIEPWAWHTTKRALPLSHPWPLGLVGVVLIHPGPRWKTGSKK